MAKLIAQSGHTLDLPRRRVTLGEASSCDIPLSTGLGLAPAHFEIEPCSDGNYLVRDVSGGAGLSVNDQLVQEWILQHGNVIGAGALRLGFWNTMVQQEVSSPFLAGARSTMEEEANTAEETESGTQPAKFIPVASLAESGGRAPSTPQSPPATPKAPPPIPVPAQPPVAEGPPVAWVNPAEENAAQRAASSGRQQVPTNTDPGFPAGDADKKPRRVKSGRRSRFSPGRVVALTAIALVAGLGAAAVRVPPVRAAFVSTWEKLTSWANPEKPESRETAATPSTPGTPVVVPPLVGEADRAVTPKAEHNEVVKRMLTERTVSLFQADLRQLVPFYNATASLEKLPPQRVITDAFHKHYGLELDAFDKLTCLRASGKDEFIFVLTSPIQVNLETMLRIPPAPGSGRPAAKAKGIRIYPVKLTGKLYGAAQFDPFTVILGQTSWIDAALNGGAGPSLREALCMFPYTAARGPGALIMVERIMHADASMPSAFQTAVSNLFFKGKGESRLTLTRNPDVKEEVFVEQSSAALKEQSAALFQSVKLGNGSAVPVVPAKKLGAAPDSGEVITTTEASIMIPDGEALLKEAIDSVARSFMSQSPAVELILAAQKAVLNFNQARLQQAPEAQSVTSVSEALELLQGGITVPNRSGGRDLIYQIDRLEPVQADDIVHLLAIEDKAGLVFRPAADRLSGTMLELAVKARDYRNAELLISLWGAAKFTKNDAQDVASAARKVLEWANKEGARQRLSVGLPSLTDTEREHATALLGFQNGQLTWKAGEEGYRNWLRKVSPDPKADAKHIAGIFTQAQKAGAIPNGKVSELADAVRLISAGVRTGTTAASNGSSTVFKVGNFTNDELRAASRYLRLEGGDMRVIDR